MRGQRKNPRKAVQPFENKKRKIDIFKNYEANGVEKIQRKLEIFSTLISKKSKGLINQRRMFLSDYSFRTAPYSFICLTEAPLSSTLCDTLTRRSRMASE